MLTINSCSKTRRTAFTTELGKVTGLDIFINPITNKNSEIFELLKEFMGDEAFLEVSSYSDNALGKSLSAFRIPYKGSCLECIFQAAKVFEKGGPYKDWTHMKPLDVKKDPRKFNSGKVIQYIFDGEIWSTDPKTAFYDYIYIDAAKQILTNDDLQSILKYKYFTDVALDPEVSTNCQARSMALIQLMMKKYGKILDFSSKESFIEFHKQYVKY